MSEDPLAVGLRRRLAASGDPLADGLVESALRRTRTDVPAARGAVSADTAAALAIAVLDAALALPQAVPDPATARPGARRRTLTALRSRAARWRGRLR